MNNRFPNHSNGKGPDGNSSGGVPDKPRSPLGRFSILTWLLLLIFALPLVWRLFAGDNQNLTIDYSVFRQHVEAGDVSRVTVTGDQITGVLKAPANYTTSDGQQVEYTDFVTYLPSFGDDQLMGLLRDQNVAVATRPEQAFSWWLVILNAVPFLLFIGLGYLLFRRMRGQGQDVMGMGKSRAKLYNRSAERTTFADVAGATGAKRELEEIIQYLREPERFQVLGGEIPKGVLLVGPPGTGKTLLARAVAGEAGVPFFSITGSDFMEMFVGVGASRVRDLFAEAKKAAPAIIFIDELDSIGRRRGAGLGGGHDEREQTLNQMLSELDGFEPNENVIVMAATNRPDILDPALLRPGRFDRQITVDLPTLKDREAILKIHARNKPLAADMDLNKIARGTPGFSGADLENILNEAALLAARRNRTEIHRDDVEDARDKVIMGLERESLVLTEEETRTLAYHEAGHAVVAAVLPHADPVHKVTIVPRGRAMGVTQQIPERDRYLYQKDYMLDRMAVMMGGRAAEELVIGAITSGAENDLKQATRLARKMVLEWGMGDGFSHIALGDARDQVFLGEEITQRRNYSEQTAREIDEEIRHILDAAYRRAYETLATHRQVLDELVAALIEHEVVPGERVMEILNLDREELEPEPAGD